MVRKSFMLLLVSVLLVGAAQAGQKRKAPAPAQRKCPISGKAVDGGFFADVDGFRILTAGQQEADEVRMNPGKAFAALAKNRDAALQLVWRCPIMMNPVSPEYPFVQKDGKRIYYCCAPCKSRIQKDFPSAAAAVKKMAEG